GPLGHGVLFHDSFELHDVPPMAERAMRRWDELKTRRSRHETMWEDIARLMRPQRGNFRQGPGVQRDFEKPLSSEPIMAASSYAAGIYSSITNPANRWGGLETPDADFNKWQPMAEWNDHATQKVLASFGASVSSFYKATYQAYADIACFGNAAGYDEVDEANRRFVDVTMSLAEVVVDIDAHGRVVELVRKYTLKPAAALRTYGEQRLPAKVVELAESSPSTDLVFFYHILPNDQFVKGKLGHRGKKWLAVTCCELEQALVKVGGHDDMPGYFPRWDVDSGETYGTGQGFIALPSARAHQLMEAATMRAAQFAADPTKLAPDRRAVPLNGTFRPGGIVYGAVDMQARARVRNMEHSTNIGLTETEKRAKLEEVKNAFQYAVMTLVGRTGVTEEETRLMEEAQLRNWAPNADRVMEEYGARKFERRFKLLYRLGQIKPPPAEAAGRPLRVRYQSMATMALRAREGQAIRQFLSDLGPLTQLDPRYLDRLDPDAVAEALHEASPSLPASILRSREEANQLADERAQQQQQAQALEAAQAAGGIAKDLGVTLGQEEMTA
ncbi:MAG: portal protein, partial [Pseudomonadota bacterium]